MGSDPSLSIINYIKTVPFNFGGTMDLIEIAVLILPLPLMTD